MSFATRRLDSFSQERSEVDTDAKLFFCNAAFLMRRCRRSSPRVCGTDFALIFSPSAGLSLPAQLTRQARALCRHEERAQVGLRLQQVSTWHEHVFPRHNRFVSWKDSLQHDLVCSQDQHVAVCELRDSDRDWQTQGGREGGGGRTSE